MKSTHRLITSLVSIALLGCAGQVNEYGKKIFLTPSDAAHLSKCELLGQVYVDTNLAGLWDAHEMKKQLKIELRNQTGMQYPQADTVAFSDLDVSIWSGDSEAMGTAFKCFSK